MPRKSLVNNPRILNTMQTLTTRNENVSPRWIRNNEPACYEINMSPIGSTKSNGLGRSLGPHTLHWRGVVIDPIWGTQANRAILHTCHMQKFEISYASLLIGWVSWLNICYMIFSSISVNLALTTIHVIFMFKHAFLD